MPRRYFKEFLEFLDIDEKQFFSTVDRFTNPLLFKKNNKSLYLRDKDQNLILEDIWYDSFNL